MGTGKEDRKSKTKKKSLSDHYSEEERYWDSFDERRSESASDRNFLLMSAKSSQKQSSSTQPEPKPVKQAVDIGQSKPDLGIGAQIPDNSEPSSTRFLVDHLATLHYPSGRPQPPEESLKRIRELASSGSLYSQQVYLVVSSSSLAIRQFESNEVINWFSIPQISRVFAVSGRKDFSNLLIVHTHDNRGGRPYIHVFGCERSSSQEIRDLLVSFLNRRYSSELPRTQQMDTIEEHSSSGEGEDPVPVPSSYRKLSIWDKLSNRPSTRTKAQIFEKGPQEEANPAKLGRTPPSHHIGLAAAELNQQRNKANLIQKDIDLLNAALDDVELTADMVHSYVVDQRAAGKKKKKKAKSASRSSEPVHPPGRSDLVDAFQKSRYAVNILGKLGHHLRNPSCSEILNLLVETVKGLSDYTGGAKLVSSVNIPLLTDRAVRLMSRGLSKELKVYWNNLGTNWMLTHASWPQAKPVPRFEPIFSNGHTPESLPLQEPTIWGNLDPLPELKRPFDYSDAYDHIQVTPTQAGDKISKDIESAVFKQAKQVLSRADSRSDSTHSLTSSKQTPQSAPRPSSLTALPQSNQLVITQDFKRQSRDQLSVYRGEIVDVLEKHSDYYLVRNTLGEQGLVPVAYIIQDKPPSRKASPSLPRKDSVPLKESYPQPHSQLQPVPLKESYPQPHSQLQPVPLKESYPQPHSQLQPVPLKDSYPQPHSQLQPVPLKESYPQPHSQLQPVPLKESYPQPHSQLQPPVSSRRGSIHGSSMGDVPNFDPTPIPPNIPPPPPDIPKGWPYNKVPAMSPEGRRKKTKQQNLFEGAGMDIVKDLQKKRPLRKTTNTPKDDPGTPPPTELAMKFQKESCPEDSKPSIKPITLDSTKEEVLEWLVHYSYLIAQERLRGMKGKDLIPASKEELRDLCGFGEGTRLFSHLQRESKGKHQTSPTVPVGPLQRSDDGETGGVPKWLKEHRNKVSGKGGEAAREEPSLWEQMQASRAKAGKQERQRQKEEIWVKRRRAREQEERRESLEVEADVEREERRASRGSKSKRRQKVKDSSDAEEERRKEREREGRQRRKGKSRRKMVSSESSASQRSDSDSDSSESDSESSYDSSDASDSEYKRENKNKKKDTPTHSSPPAATPVPAAPQFSPQPPGVYPTMAGPVGVPLARYAHPTQLGYLPPTPHMGIGMPYSDIITQQMLLQQQQHQQVANAEQEAWNADMRLKQLRSQQAMGMSSPTTMFASYPPHVTPMLGPAAPYGYSTFDRNYTSII